MSFATNYEQDCTVYIKIRYLADDDLLSLKLGHLTCMLLLLCTALKTKLLLTVICCFYLQDGNIFLFVDNFKNVLYISILYFFLEWSCIFML